MGNLHFQRHNKTITELLRKWAIAVFAITVFIWFLFGGKASLPIAKFFFMRQDIFLLSIICVCWFLHFKTQSQFIRFSHSLFIKCARFCSQRKYAAGLFAIFLGVVCYAGHYLLLDGYANSRDEQMAVFDSEVFRQGLLVAPIDQKWRAFAAALNQMFMVTFAGQEAWVSSYLPVNAGFRTLFSFMGDAALTGPFFVALGALALYQITQQLWPDRRELPVLAMIFYAGSGQIIFNGMTAYAMNGHLALNLVWLSLFLMHKKRYDIAALAIGFLATGLHQPLFHPLFAAPILTILVIQKNWSRALFYLAGYAVICAFWLYWPHFISTLGAGQAPGASYSIDYYARLLEMVKELSASSVLLMLLNLLRFAGWQHIFLLPLLGLGILAAFRQRRDPNIILFLALAISFFLPMFIMLIILPDQGYGWGYRYMHGVIGNGILLAVFGWQHIKQATIKYKILLVSTALNFLAIMPVQAYAMNALYAPFADIDRAINTSQADIVLIDTDSFVFAQDLVFNLPDFENKPVRMGAKFLKHRDFDTLCKGNKAVMALGYKQMTQLQNYWQDTGFGKPKMLAEKLNAAKQAGCTVTAFRN